MMKINESWQFVGNGWLVTKWSRNSITMCYIPLTVETLPKDKVKRPIPLHPTSFGYAPENKLIRYTVYGGWLVELQNKYNEPKGLVFIPDPEHNWRVG